MRGALAGGAGSFVLGAVFTPASISDSVFLLGYVAALAVYVIEGAAIGSGLGLASAMARDFGARKLGFVTYDRTLRAERFLLVARGTTEQTDRAKSLIVIGSR
jgi:hypothetical protein